MRVEKAAFLAAAEAAGIDAARASDTWQRLEVTQPARPPFAIATIAYYIGALIVIGAMTFFMVLGIASGPTTLLRALGYAAAFLIFGNYLYRRPDTRVPGGLLIAAAVSLTPLAVYGFERTSGLWSQGDPGTYDDFFAYIRGSWFAMEASTVVTASIALYFFRAPFIMLPLSFVGWYMSMDIAPLIFGKNLTWDQRCWTSVVVGLVMMGVAFAIDRRTRDDYAFWLYLFGTTAFFGGLCLLQNSTEPSRAAYAALCVFSILVSAIIGRRVFLVYGAAGLAAYLGHLSWEVFNGEPVAFTFSLTVIGLAIIALGIAYQRNEEKIVRAIDARIPLGLRNALPRSRA